MARGQMIRNDATGETLEWRPGQGWTKVYDNIPQPGAIETSMIQAGGEVARLWEGARQLAGAAPSPEAAGAQALMDDLSRDRPVASFIGRALPSFAIPGAAGAGIKALATNALAGGAYGFLGAGSLGDRLTSAGFGAAGSMLGGAVGSRASSLGSGAAGYARAPRGALDIVGELGPESSTGTIAATVQQMTPEQMATRARQLVDELTPDQLATRPAPEASLERNRLMSRADELELLLTPADVANSRPGKLIEASAESHPFTAALFEPVREHNRTRMSQIALDAIGEKGPASGPAELSPSVFGAAHDRLAKEFQAVEVALGDRVPLDSALVQDVGNIVQRQTESMYGKAEVATDANKLLEIISKGASGKQLMAQRSRMVAAMRDASTKGEGAYAQETRDLLEAFDDFIDRRIRGDLSNVDTNTGEIADIAGQWGRARNQFRALKTLESPGVVNGKGEIVGTTLARRMERDYPAEFKRGDQFGTSTPEMLALFDAARISGRFGDIVGNSGTATRAALGNIINSPIMGTAALITSQTAGRVVKAAVRNRTGLAAVLAGKDAYAKAMAEALKARALGAQAGRAGVAGAGGD